jgi:organic hydroperoxide reductase OsmC/OhrA
MTGRHSVRISAILKNSRASHDVSVATGKRSRARTSLAARAAGSGINGGELLTLALAPCYCNDLYREAARLGVSVESVEAEAADFEDVGLAAMNIRYRARVVASGSGAEVAKLLRETDAIAEIHDTLRASVAVRLEALGPHR